MCDSIGYVLCFFSAADENEHASGVQVCTLQHVNSHV